MDALKVAQHLGVRQKELKRLGILTLLSKKKKEIMRDKLEILSNYGVSSVKEIKEKIEKGKVKEHPAWEDLIILENLDFKMKEINNDIKNL